VLVARAELMCLEVACSLRTAAAPELAEAGAIELCRVKGTRVERGNRCVRAGMLFARLRRAAMMAAGRSSDGIEGLW
jgi:hypothetical protein